MLLVNFTDMNPSRPAGAAAVARTQGVASNNFHMVIQRSSGETALSSRGGSKMAFGI